MRTSEFKDAKIEKVYSLLGSSKNGLSEEEASRRLEKYGYNEIEEKKQNYILLFLGKFFGPIPIVLWLIIILSYLLHHIVDFYVVLALLVFNAIVSFAEEYKADKSIELLKERLSVNARVLRSGAWVVMPSKNLVIGDIVRVRLGDIAPADAKVIEADALECDESELTGESMPVAKGAGDIIYAGSTLKRGEATCIVVGTGSGTYFGKTARLVETARPKSNLEKMIMRIMKYLIAIDILVVIAMFLYGTFMLSMGLGIILPFLLIVFIASVPVALPATFTVAMAYGTEKLAKKSILVTKLEAIEETSTMNVLCMDKTGTLTEDKIIVKEVFPLGSSKDNVIEYAAECSRVEDKDPIDMAIISDAHALGIKQGAVVHFSPFDPETKRSEASVKGIEGKLYYVTKGTPQVIAGMCRLTGNPLRAFEKKVEEFSSKGLRSIAVAVKKDKQGYRLAGLIALYDQPRQQAKPLVKELVNLGIKPIMLTGDNIAVAKEVASELGFGSKIMNFSDISESESFEAQARSANGFAGIYPEDKFKIVKALQGKGYSIGMTGDGVNDAPALKQAEVGIAVANATDVAKSAADLVLTRSGIGVIVEAVKESRRIFERMVTYTIVKMVKIIQILSFVAIVFFAFRFIPILPVQLIILIFTNDIVNMAIATDNSNYSAKPDVWHVRPLMYSSIAIGLILMLQAFLLLPISFGIFHMSTAAFETMAFFLLSVSDKFTIYNVREKRFFWKSKPSKMLVLSSFMGIIASMLIAYYGIFMQSIGIIPIIVVLALGLAFLLIVDVVKVYIFRRLNVR
ncbi:MAG: plasma-membrane proton-efflux P-type ATPase [Candidatus Micrarchaeia archaeon]